MADLLDKTIATDIQDDDYYYLVRDPSGTPLDRRIAASDLLALKFAVVFPFYEGGSVLTTGTKLYLGALFPVACEIVSHELVGNTTGSIVIDLWKDLGTNYPPTNADSITASAKPTLSSAQRATDSTLTGWGKTIAAGSWIVPEIESVSTLTYAALVLIVKRTF